MADGTSIRDTLSAAIAEGRGETSAAEAVGDALAGRVAAPEATPAPVADPAPAVPVAETPKDAKAPDPAAPGAPERDEQGRFKPKAGQEGAQAAAPAAETKTDTETAKPAGEGPQTEATRIPPSLPAAVKAIWTDLQPEVRQAFAHLEDSVQKAKAEWGPKGQRLNRFDEILGPHLDKWRFAGLDEFSGVQTLLSAQNILERNPVEGLVHIARSYGVSPQQIAQALGLPQTTPQPGADGQQATTAQPDLSAALQPFMQRVQTLEQRLESADQARVLAEIETVRTKPENKYFDNVQNDVVAFLQSGLIAKEGRSHGDVLQEAYDRACWANPEIRALLTADQARRAAPDATRIQQEAARKAADDARTKAAQAAQASGSVTGSPTPGAQPLTPGPSLELRDELKANLAAARASV